MAPSRLPHRRSEVGRALLGSALAVALALAGCTRKEGAPFECECEFLTDYDDASKQAVRVCAKDDGEALVEARGCAQLAAPAPVQSCRCARAQEAGPPCRIGCRD